MLYVVGLFIIQLGFRVSEHPGAALAQNVSQKHLRIQRSGVAEAFSRLVKELQRILSIQFNPA
jgi:hypothetical protein